MTESEQGHAGEGLGHSLPLEQKATSNKNPWRPKLFDMADISAIKAVSAGTATPDQQMRAMQYIIVVLCAADDMSYRPGEDGRRDSDFAEGGRWVGVQLKRIILSRMDDLMMWVKQKVNGSGAPR